jgi:hypothetical protein
VERVIIAVEESGQRPVASEEKLSAEIAEGRREEGKEETVLLTPRHPCDLKKGF